MRKCPPQGHFEKEKDELKVKKAREHELKLALTSGCRAALTDEM